jgi:hypothetical protein
LLVLRMRIISSQYSHCGGQRQPPTTLRLVIEVGTVYMAPPWSDNRADEAE